MPLNPSRAAIPILPREMGQLGPSAGPWAGSLGSLGKGFVNSSGPPLQRWLLGSARGGSCPPGSQVPGPGRPLGATRVTFEPLPGTPGGLGPDGPVLALISVLPASVRRGLPVGGSGHPHPPELRVLGTERARPLKPRTSQDLLLVLAPGSPRRGQRNGRDSGSVGVLALPYRGHHYAEGVLAGWALRAGRQCQGDRTWLGVQRPRCGSARRPHRPACVGQCTGLSVSPSSHPPGPRKVTSRGSAVFGDTGWDEVSLGRALSPRGAGADTGRPREGGGRRGRGGHTPGHPGFPAAATEACLGPAPSRPQTDQTADGLLASGLGEEAFL